MAQNTLREPVESALKWSRRRFICSSSAALMLAATAGLRAQPIFVNPAPAAGAADGPVGSEAQILKFLPQFYMGSEDRATMFVEVGFSFHCEGSRIYFRKTGKSLVDDIRNDRTVALFSHIVRTKNELPVGVELMKIGPNFYPAAVFATLGLTFRTNRSLSAAEVRDFLSQAGFRRDPDISEENIRLALIGMREAYRTRASVKATPYVYESRIR